MDKDRQSISVKMKQLAGTRRDKYENVGVGITNMLTGPTHMALPAPPAPSGLSRSSMPPPPPPPPTPSTPTSNCNNIPRPTPAPTPITRNGKHTEPMAEELSANKRQKKANVLTHSSPHNLGSQLTRTLSESSVRMLVRRITQGR
jgi:hypothetical protein